MPQLELGERRLAQLRPQVVEVVSAVDRLVERGAGLRVELEAEVADADVADGPRLQPREVLAGPMRAVEITLKPRGCSSSFAEKPNTKRSSGVTRSTGSAGCGNAAITTSRKPVETAISAAPSQSRRRTGTGPPAVPLAPLAATEPSTSSSRSASCSNLPRRTDAVAMAVGQRERRRPS